MENKEEKIKQVEKLAEGLKGSQAVVFSDYAGLSVAEMSELRKKLGELGAVFKVIKNTLIKLAAEKAGVPFEELAGPTAVLLSQEADPIECVKAVVSIFKEAGKGEVKFGIFEGSLLDVAGISELAFLPSKAALQGRLVGMLISPIFRFVTVLQGTQRSFVSVLDQIGKSKGGEG